MFVMFPLYMHGNNFSSWLGGTGDPHLHRVPAGLPRAEEGLYLFRPHPLPVLLSEVRRRGQSGPGAPGHHIPSLYGGFAQRPVSHLIPGF